jgi:hypothetical protein
MADKPRICDIEACGNTLSPRSKLDTCQVCRSSDYYWKPRASRILPRRLQLTKLASRADRLIDLGFAKADTTTKRRARR